MTALPLKELFRMSLTNPREAADYILSLGIGRAELWQALVAFTAISTLINGITMMIFPPPPEYPSIVTVPFLSFAVVTGGATLMVHILTWAGRSLGGQGTLDTVLLSVVWLQMIWLVFDVVAFVLMLAAPGLALIFVMATAMISLWVFLNFLAAAHQFTSLWRAFTVLFVSFVGLVLSMSVLAALAGVGSLEGVSNV